MKNHPPRKRKIAVNLYYVVDGDTVWFKGMKRSTRLARVDAPEFDSPCPQKKKLAHKAKYFVRDFITKARKVEMLYIRNCYYGRYLAEVWCDGENLSDLLLENNLAIPYRPPKKEKIRHSENKATSNYGDMARDFFWFLCVILFAAFCLTFINIP